MKYKSLKLCSKCKEFKDQDYFYSQKKHSKKRGDYVYYNPECKECTIKRSYEWIVVNYDEFKKNYKNYMKTDSWKDYKNRNNENTKELQSEWRKDNREYVNLKSKIWYQNKEHVISHEEIMRLYEYCGYLCMYCGIAEKDAILKYNKRFFKDHFINDGSNEIDNCILCCNGCSSSKRDKSFEEWYTPQNERYSDDRYMKIVAWIESFKNNNT